ncbi:GGDEF domain-containing protein [Paenibacillus sp. ACRRY]|uniref:diguanylate cyclase domain-containing protein n=1 Tax=Paenibacillus sp. ACRRY TaxID=2918208 RepID=UPI001EF5BEC6|nr:GGDEF domain-containing protein [Paenibacillus sp. ACRRY]
MTAGTKCDIVYHIFKSNPNLEGLAVVGEDTVSLMMRARFFQQIGTQYGYNLYMGRPVELVVNVRALVVDYSELITDVSVQAMNRAEEELYDLVLITSENRLVGAVSIRRLLLAVADVRAEMAIFMNPLTGLPGNRIIDDRLYQTLQLGQFSVLYIDLDYFKSYNDSYGFKMGDQLIQATANLLRQYFVFPESFLGHIGGDDFIAILNHHDFRQVSEEVIAGFEKIKRTFYNQEDLDNQFVLGEGRSGIHRPIPLVSVSIAVVTNASQEYEGIDQIVKEATRIKKVCKSIAGSVICGNEDAL